METLDLLLWSDDNQFGGYQGYLVIPEDEVEEGVIYCGDDLQFIEGVPVSDIEAVKEKMDQYEDDRELDLDVPEDLEIFLKDLGYQNAEVYQTGYYEKPRKIIAYLPDDKALFNWEDAELYGFEETKKYEYFDGARWETISTSTDGAYREMESIRVTKQSVSLDEWDERVGNFYTSHHHHHQHIHKVILQDGKEPSEPLFLLKKTTSWANDMIPLGVVLELDELKEHLKGLGRDLREYLHDILNLDGS